MVRIQISGARGRTEQKNLTQPAVLGRDPECDLVIDDQQISRQHCRVEPQPDGVLVIDLNSRNGVYVNGQRLMRHLLKPGEVLEIGNSTLRLQVPQTLSSPSDVKPEAAKDQELSPVPVISDSNSTTLAPAQDTAAPKARHPDSFTRRQAMWEKAAATRQGSTQGSKKGLLGRLRLSGDDLSKDPATQASPNRLKKKIAIGFVMVTLAALLYQGSSLFHSDNSVAPVKNSQPQSHQTVKNRAISD